MACTHQDAPFCRRFADGTICEDHACGLREQRNVVVEEAVEAQLEDVSAEAALRDLTVVAADGVSWLLCGWALAMFFLAVRCASHFAWIPCFSRTLVPPSPVQVLTNGLLLAYSRHGYAGIDMQGT